MTAVAHPEALTAGEGRALFRSSASLPTTGSSAAYTQANLISVAADWTYEVLLFCQRKPKPCPDLDVTDPRSFSTPLAVGADLRTDVPRCRVWENGELFDELAPPDFRDLVEEEPGDVPVFWANEVTPLAAVMASRPPFAITHARGVHADHRRTGCGLPPRC
ncbi:uncharacterized protein YcsI (UPF0317 family) [Streptomyces sp. V4I23]|nr:uncharacterized protein YcsI (UPF0317 family) [Streptomyces sp. V4I23]